MAKGARRVLSVVSARRHNLRSPTATTYANACLALCLSSSTWNERDGSNDVD